MGFIARLRALMRVMRRRKRPMETQNLLRLRPALLLGVSSFEMALLASGRLDSHVKVLASIKTSALVGCPF